MFGELSLRLQVSLVEVKPSLLHVSTHIKDKPVYARLYMYLFPHEKDLFQDFTFESEESNNHKTLRTRLPWKKNPLLTRFSRLDFCERRIQYSHDSVSDFQIREKQNSDTLEAKIAPAKHDSFLPQ
ncbi:hypothetical protein BaRGS_00002924 [Batillaria attramentaria]|uniref:Uncharacterized protein n=1 Tax=Batillaria attramentaria TaxID=370345 RepID=A0ABD0M311_9CAEN